MNVHRVRARIDDDDHARTAAKPLECLLRDLGIRVVRRNDFDGQVWWAVEKLWRVDEAFRTDERDIGGEDRIWFAGKTESSIRAVNLAELPIENIRRELCSDPHSHGRVPGSGR